MKTSSINPTTIKSVFFVINALLALPILLSILLRTSQSVIKQDFTKIREDPYAPLGYIKPPLP